MKNIIGMFARMLPENVAYAHCDIPCGIYDPYPAQIAAHSVLRMTMLIKEVEEKEEDKTKAEYISLIARLTKVKEDHAEILKKEIRVIWGDYFKEENMVEGLHEKVFDIMHTASKARQEVDIDAANDLIEKVAQFSEIFYKSKGLETMRIPSGFPTKGEIVVHK